MSIKQVRLIFLTTDRSFENCACTLEVITDLSPFLHAYLNV